MATYLIVVPYLTTLILLCLYGLHRSQLVILLRRHWRRLPPPPAELPAGVSGEGLPHVTVQLPLFNEPDVVEKLIDAVAGIEYPRDKFEIQVLDDSTDDTRDLAKAKVAEIVRRGIDAVYIHRHDRTGYKAGALAYGQKLAKGELIAVFDADFKPLPNFLRAIVPHFRDPKVGCVQARWGHINREHSLLTGVQALMLDGHHMVENRARYAAGRFFNFSGTGGVWRKQAIVDAGGWEHDTITEDLDLSYRAQMAGWKFVYREDHVTPAELPEEMEAFRAQQFRWAKGTVQTARKLLKRIWARKDLSFSVRLEAVFHMTPHFAYPLMLFLSAFLLPMLLVMPASDPISLLMVDVPLMVGSTGSVVAFYVTADLAQGRSAWDALRRLPALMALGCGMSPYLAKAVREGLRAMAGEFVRTPKKGEKDAKSQRYHARTQLPWVEMVLALENAIAVVAAIQTRHYLAAPFALLFSFGYAWVATLVARERLTFAQPVTVRPRLVTPVAAVDAVREAGAAEATDSLAA